jgi:anti-anti-sigma regulatory factor
MTLRIEKVASGPVTTIRLIGRVRAELLEELTAQIKASGTTVVLDLEEVSLVDVEVVRFLGDAETQGIQLVHCSPYIADWIRKERTCTSQQSEPQ